MSSPETIFQATLNRLASRFKNKFIEKSSDFSEIAEKIQKELDILQQEIIVEVQRIENEKVDLDTKKQSETIEDEIDEIRGKIAKLNRLVEEVN